MIPGDRISSADEIRQFYRSRASTDPYATSPDFNLREIEINFISRHLLDKERVLDVGCGNGYSTLCFGTHTDAAFCAIDSVWEMIAAARALQAGFRLKGKVAFQLGDVTALNYRGSVFDTVISQRCLLNLPSKEHQWRALAEVARVLRPGGRYLMLEGTQQGLQKLNDVRARFDLPPIAEADRKTNWFSNKFDEDELLDNIHGLFSKVEKTERFGMYYLISRVIHPLLVAPEAPKYDARINAVAREVCLQIPDYDGLGHIALWIVRK